MKSMLTIANKSNSEDFLNFAYKNDIRDFRVNMAYEEDALRAIERLRALPRDIRVFVDYPAEKQRLQLPNHFAEKEFSLGENVMLSVITNGGLYISNIHMMDKILPGHCVSFADGKVIGEVVDRSENQVIIRILKGGVLRNNAGCCFVGKNVPSPSITKEYCKSILYSEPLVSHNPFTTWVILSFANDVESIEDFVKEMHKRSIYVMAKIETPNAVTNLKQISTVVDGIMIGRGDLKNISGDDYLCNYYLALSILAGLPASLYKGIGTFFLLNYAMSMKLEDADINDFRLAEESGSDFIMFSKEVVNSNYPRETVILANKILRKEI